MTPQAVEGKNLVGMELADLREALGPQQPSYRAQQLYDALYRKQVANLSDISDLPKALRDQLLRTTSVGLPVAERRYDSVDGTRRYLLRLEDNRTVEAVLMPEEKRGTICISSQIGCPVDCKFCLTALMGLERNLAAGEIVGQVLYVARENGLKATASQLNVVMMGMGEPLLNLDNVLKATRLLTDPTGIAMSPKRITVSTSGIVPMMQELGRAEIRPKLAISLNAST
ncbi:MAG: radical enzyme Cfr family, partial [Bryobacterales bacterium]|nr:radical enzyme Cfr family [Bryobacterales bacterium]